jgi:hypothetical protein
MLYHETKYLYYAKDFLGYKQLSNAEIYINIERTIFEPPSDSFAVKAAEKPERVKELMEIRLRVCMSEG